jgi:hypothetical protein
MADLDDALVAAVRVILVFAIEHGKRQPQVRTLEKLADALGAEVKDFSS